MVIMHTISWIMSSNKETTWRYWFISLSSQIDKAINFGGVLTFEKKDETRYWPSDI